jgi:hypothetical protein
MALKPLNQQLWRSSQSNNSYGAQANQTTAMALKPIKQQLHCRSCHT